MSSKRSANNYLKYAAVAFLAIFLVSAAFLLLDAWERGLGRFPEMTTEGNFIEYNGETYVPKNNQEITPQ